VTVVALTHGYPPAWPMGGEVALHRTLLALDEDVIVLTRTDEPYELEGIRVLGINTPDVLNIAADPTPIARQLVDVGARVVIAQNELSRPATLACRMVSLTSIVSVHTPPKYGKNIRAGVRTADAAVYNTRAAAIEWGEPRALVVHPPVGPLPPAPATLPPGDAYTVLSSLLNKGIEVVLELAARMPRQRFIVVRSPAEPTHGISDLEERVAALPNVELHPRVTPEEVAERYFSQTRILLVPSRYETYGMSAIEAAGYGIPTVHVDTPHVREGIGVAAQLVPALDTAATLAGIERIEADYPRAVARARERAEMIAQRQVGELAAWSEFVQSVQHLSFADSQNRQQRISQARGRR